MPDAPLQAALKVVVLGVAVRAGPVVRGSPALDVVLHVDVELAVPDAARQAALLRRVLHVPVGAWSLVICRSAVYVITDWPEVPPTTVGEALPAPTTISNSHTGRPKHVVGRANEVPAMTDAAFEAVLNVGILRVAMQARPVALTHTSENVLLHRQVVLAIPDSAGQAVLEVVVL